MGTITILRSQCHGRDGKGNNLTWAGREACGGKLDPAPTCLPLALCPGRSRRGCSLGPRAGASSRAGHESFQLFQTSWASALTCQLCRQWERHKQRHQGGHIPGRSGNEEPLGVARGQGAGVGQEVGKAGD